MSLPILAVDVDGVISLFGFEQPPGRAEARYELGDGTMHCISLAAGGRLRRLAEHYELIWATGWEDKANYYLPALLGLRQRPQPTLLMPTLSAQGIEDTETEALLAWAEGLEFDA